MREEDLINQMAHASALGKTVAPVIQDLCPLLKKVCSVGDALCGIQRSHAFEEVKQQHKNDIMSDDGKHAFLLLLIVMLLASVFFLLFCALKSCMSDDNESKKRKWNKVKADMENRSERYSKGYAKDFYNNGDIKHGIKLVRYLLQCDDFTIPEGDVTLQSPNIVTINKEGYIRSYWFADDKLPSPDDVWYYALGCLRYCKNQPSTKLHKLLSKLLPEKETENDATEKETKKEPETKVESSACSEKAKGKWDRVLADMRARTACNTVALVFFKHGDLGHALLILSYLKATGFKIPRMDRFIASKDIRIVNIADTLNEKKFDNLPPLPADAWEYAKGCLRNHAWCLGGGGKLYKKLKQLIESEYHPLLK